MTDHANLSGAPHDLLLQIERKDQRFRRTQALFFLLIALLLGLLLTASVKQSNANGQLLRKQNQIITNQTSQITAQKNELSDLKNTINTDAQQQQKYIQCLVNLSFAPKPVTQAQVNACLAGAQIPPQANNSASSSGGATGATKSGAVNGQAPTTPHNTGSVSAPTPTAQPTPQPATQAPSDLDKLPLVGGVFKALGV